jgi:hypothetical protein
MLKGGEIVGSEDSEWKYSAFFVKSDMMWLLTNPPFGCKM